MRVHYLIALVICCTFLTVCMAPALAQKTATISVDSTINTPIVYVIDSYDTSNCHNPEYLEHFRLQKTEFTATTVLTTTFLNYRVKHVQFPSDFDSPDTQNNTVHLTYYQPLDKENTPCAIILGNLGGRFIMARAVAIYLVKHGIAAVVIDPPYFGKRSDVEYKNRV